MTIRSTTASILTLLFLVFAAAKFTLRGPVLAWSLSQDFKTFYCASRAWSFGMNPYDHRLLNSILDRAGASGQGHTWEEEPSIYPPLTYAALGPIGLLPWRPARLLWCVLNLSCLAALIALLGQLGSFARWEPRAFLLVAGILALQPVSAAMRVGQLSILVTFFATAGVLLSHYRRSYAGGCLLGIAVAVKPQLALAFLVPDFLRRHLKTLLAILLTISVIGAVAVLRLHGFTSWLGSWLSNLKSSFAHDGVNSMDPSSVHNRNMVNLQYALRTIIPSALAVNALSLIIGLALAKPALRILTTEDLTDALILESLSLLAVVELLVMYHRDYDAVLLAIPLAWALSPRVALGSGWPALLIIAVFFFPVLHMLYALDNLLPGHPPSSSLLFRIVAWPYQSWALLALAWWLSHCCAQTERQLLKAPLRDEIRENQSAAAYESA